MHEAKPYTNILGFLKVVMRRAIRQQSPGKYSYVNYVHGNMPNF